MSAEKTMEGADQGLEAEQTTMPHSNHAQPSSPQHVHTTSDLSSEHEPSSPIVDDEKLNANDDALKPTGSNKSQAESMSAYRVVIIMLSLCMALFLAALDVTIITTALPTIAGVFKASSSGYTWIGSAYLLANAASVPLWGKLSDIWGRKPIILVANIVFMVGSLIAALSQSVGMLISGRAIQGIGGGGLIILVNICISDLFTEKVSWRWCLYV